MKAKRKVVILVVIAVILVVAFSISYFRFRKDLAAGYARLRDLRPRIYSSRYDDVEYVLAGAGPTMLVSHGVTGGIDQGMGLADLYVGKGYRFLYVSRFGYLGSSMPKGASARRQADAYDGLLTYLHIDRAFVLGNSAGGPSAIHFAIDHPERCSGLILVSSAVPGNTSALPPKIFMSAVFGSDLLYWYAVKSFAGGMLKMFVPGPILKALSPMEKKRLVDDVLLSGMPISRRTKGVLFDMYVSNLSLGDDIPYERITAPALIIHAVDDPAPPIAGARLLAKRIPGCELVEFARGGHLLLGHEDEIKRAIHGFVFNGQGK